MEELIELDVVDIGSVRKYSLSELDVIDFSTSDDFAVVVESMKNLIILKMEIEEIWNKEHEQYLWQFVIDPESVTFVCYLIDNTLYLSFTVPNTPVNGFFYFIKTTSEKLTSEGYNLKIMYGTTKAPYFDSFYNLLYKVYFPMFLENIDWSKCIKTDYLQHQSKFLSQIFDLRNELNGELIFYVPKDALELTENVIVQDKELLNEIERNVMKWIWMLISLLVKQNDNDSDKRCGPLEELEFWEEKCVILNKAIEQLNRKDVKKCIEILKNGKSGCLSKMIAVQEQLMDEIAVASGNVKFLTVLKKPCELIQSSKLTDIPTYLNLLLNSIKIIWKHSSYFNSTNEISSLICKVNNFIIETCAKHIPLESIFSETSFEQDEVLLDAIQCCNSWIRIFNISEEAHKKFAEQTWSVEPVTPLMNLFIHRCEELIEVSEFKKQFKCDFVKTKYFKGHKCFEVAEQFEAIETTFWILLKELAKYQNFCLNIHTMVWYDNFKKFKLEMRDLESSVSKLMSNIVDNIKEIEDGIQVLMMFEKYFRKEVINRDLKKCVKSLYEIFFNQVSFVKKKIFESRRSSNPFIPNYAGVAFNLSTLSKKLKLQYQLLKSSSCLWPEEFSMNIDDQYQQVLEAIRESIHTISLQWIRTIPKDPYGWLKNPMIIKVESSHFIQVNLDSNIINLIEELYYWDKTGIEIPHHIHKLHEKSDVYLKRILRVLQNVKIYNRIVSVLQTSAADMFSATLESLEIAVLPALLGLNWSSPLPAVNSSLKCLSEQVKSVTDILSHYEESNVQICNICKEIKIRSLFSSNIKSPMEFSEFIQMQVTFKENNLKEIQKSCLEIISISKKLHNTYQKKKPEDDKFYSIYMEIIRKYICESLVECLLTSLKAVSSLFGIDRKNKMRVIIKIILTLKDNQPYFSPTFKELCLQISNLSENMKNGLAHVAKFEESFFENYAVEKEFYGIVKSSDLLKEVSNKIDFGLYELHKAQKCYIEEWKPFSRLWETDRITFLTEYKAKKWKASCFEDDINEFEDIAGKILHVQPFRSLDFCICDCSSLKNMAVAYSNEWKKELGSVFNDILSLNLENAYELMELTSRKFLIIPKTLEELKSCQKFLIKSNACSLNVQSTFKSIHEIFCTLEKFGIKMSREVYSQEKFLDKNWEKLEKGFDMYYTKLQKLQAFHLRQFLAFHKNLEQEIVFLQKDFHMSGPFQLKYDFSEALQKILLFKNKIVDYKEKEFCMKGDSKFFHISLKPLDLLKFLESELDNLRIAWIYAKDIDEYILEWQAISLLTFDVPEKKRISDTYRKLIIQLQEDVKGKHWILLEELQRRLQKLEEYYIVILNFQEPTLQERHWDSLKYTLELPPDETVDFFQSTKFNFEFLQNLKTDNLIQKTNVIAMQARKEYELEQGLKKIEDIWENIIFNMSPHNALYKLDDTESIISIIEDHQTGVTKMKSSRFVSHFSDQIDALENSLCLILDVIDQANFFQTKFFFLEKILLDQTVQAQLPKETVQFQELIKLWQIVSTSIDDEQLVWKISHKLGFLPMLIEMNEKIQAVQKSLEAYLESKRRAFPRFYFLSDDDLLSIIGQDNPKDIQPYLRKCFSGINQLEFFGVVEGKGRQQQTFTMSSGMHSACKEYVGFLDSVSLDGPVEFWMLDIEEMMQKSLKGLLHKCLEELLYNVKKDEFCFFEMKWLYNWPGQICLLAMQVAWTAETTAAIKLVQESAVIVPLRNLKKKWKETLNYFIKKLASESQVLMQLKCTMMITTLVNLCDIINYLIKCVCNDPNAFEWLVQIRFFYDGDKEECSIHQTKAVLTYGFEYLGNRERLIITPLTERCFISITTAFFLHHGVLMKGSKACGKTETLKELGKLIGNYILIINCSENLTHFSLVHMLSGLAQIGAWGIFEEFDNVHFEILSILTQQINVIFHSLSVGSNFFSFLGKENVLDEKCGILLTVNADRNANTYTLPLALIDIFRPVTIISPDILTVIEVHLIAYDFEQAKALSKDIYLIFKVAKEQLSDQHHYDFGLRIVISFLKNLHSLRKTFTVLSVTEVIAASFNSTVIPMLISDDVPVFQMVLETILDSSSTVLQDTLNLCLPVQIKNTAEDVLKQNSLCVSESAVRKIIEFHEMINFYHAIVLLGETGSGKTVTLKTLKDVYSVLDTSSEKQEEKITAVHDYHFNPKAFSSQELFGYFNPKGEWIDGLFPTVLREACNNTKAIRKWIILEGPVDMEWIKNISSLLDSTKVLTLANGERILLPEKVLMIIKTTELSHCSPGTVSHCGVVYHHPNNVSWEAYFYSWLKKVDNQNISKWIKELSDKYLEPIVEFTFKSLEKSETFFVNHIHCIASFCKIMDILIKQVNPEKTNSDQIARLFWFSAVWTIGSVIDERGQHLFNEFIHSLSDCLPSQGSMFNFGLDEHLQWIKWDDLLPTTWSLNKRTPPELIMVPTKMSIAYEYIIKNLLNEMYPVFLVGKMCSGKSTIAKCMLNSLSPEQYKYTMLNVSCQSSPRKLQHTVELQMIKKAGNIYIPDFGRKLIVFLDDMHLAIPDQYESIPFLELLTMQLNCHYWFNRQNWKMNHILNTVYLCAMTPMSSIKRCESFPSPRLLSHFNVFNILPASEPEMKHIFTSLLREKFADSSIEVQRMINAISLGSLDVLKSATSLFRPTPSRFHYLFSMHDIKKVIFRLLEITPKDINDKTLLTKFWLHECLREFSDKLISEEDKIILFQIMCEVVSNQFLIPLSDFNVESKPLFAKFLNPSKEYQEVKDLASLTKSIENCIRNYKNVHSSSPVVLFDQAVEHLCQIIRGIEVPYGNVFLVGISGTGRLTLSRLAAYILKYEVFEVEIKKSYGIHDFKCDLQKLLHTCGVLRKDVVFLITDVQIKNDEFLQYITEISTGEIADLFNPTELEQICTEMMQEYESEDIKRHECVRVFIENIRKHLHIVFCVNYATPFYKKCIVHYPAVYKYSTCIWFENWPRVALESIAKKQITNFNFVHSAEERSQVCCRVLPEIHVTVMKYSKDRMRSNAKIYHTSSAFITFVNTFKSVFHQKSKKVHDALERLESGLIKIHETQEKVNEIAKETKEAQEMLIIAEKKCDEALVDIKAKEAIVAEKQEAIHEKKVEIEKNEKICKKIAIAAQEDLNAALPALEEARKALEALNKRDIGEIKSYAKPPALVEMVLEAVMILRNSEPSWTEAKRQLGSPAFLKELIEYDRDNISDLALRKIEKYVKKSDFNPLTIGKVSVAAKSLCIWVHAMHMYGQIYKKVKPKKERLRIAQEQLLKLQNILAALLKELNELQAAIDQLQREHDLLLAKKEEYAKAARILSLKLERANSIIQGLSSERKRWNSKALALSEKKKLVFGDSFIASGYVAYLGPYDQDVRLKICDMWEKLITAQNVLCASEFDLAEFFIDDSTMTEWTACGLPTDQYSHENAAIVTESYCCPFIIDPEGQAVKWIKNMESKQGLRCCDLQDNKWLPILENAVIEGYPVLLQSMNAQLDSTLEPLFNKTNIDPIIIFNKKELILHKNFRLYISSKSSHPEFSSILIKKMCIVNFTIKEKGLEDQLLPLIVRNERSDLEITKEKLVKSIRESKAQLLDIENTILKLLSESRGSLLDDEVLVEALNRSKSSSLEIEEKLSSNEKTETVIDSARQKYHPGARNAAILYFVVSNMSVIDSIYVFTLDAYMNLFLDSISKSPRDSNVNRRIQKLKLYHQFAVYKYACRTVSKKHSLLLAFHICCRILNSEGKLDREEYEFFICGGRAFDPASDPPNPCQRWLPQKCWEFITQLERLPKFIGITVSLDETSKNWQEWYLTSEPEKIFLPGNWRNICNDFERLLVIRCLRSDRISNCVRNFVLNNIGKRFLEYPQMNLEDIIKDSAANKPILLFKLSNDVDIDLTLVDLANKFEMSEKYRTIMLGEGQGPIAAQLIVDAAKLGFWVFISNCHLLLSWMPDLEKIVNKLATVKVNPDFRLFLGSSPTEFFPASILQCSVVLTFDAPKGIRENMLKLYQTDILNSNVMNKQELKYRSLVFSLAFFHSLLIERKKFQNFGWNANYSFTAADFKVSVKMLQTYLSIYKETPWDAFKTSIADICYRNHMIHEKDECLLMTYFYQYFCDEACSNSKFQLTDLESYYIPEDGPFEDYVKYIKSLPLFDVAEVFGQHPNSEILYRIREGESLLQNLSKFLGDTSISKEGNVENQMIKIIEDLKLEVPNKINEEEAENVLAEKSEPYSYVLVQETKKYNSLLDFVMKSLYILKDNMTGKQKMTEKSEYMMNFIRKMEVPPEWHFVYPSLKPLGSWIQDLKLRIEQFQVWCSAGNPPIKFWLSGFASPKSLLNAVLLTAVKDSDMLFKDLEWEYHVSTLDEVHIKEAPSEGMYVKGLFLEGAGWDKTNSMLTEPEPLHLSLAMPVIHFKPVVQSSMRGLYTCPCFYTSNRKNDKGDSYLFDIKLKTKKAEEHWIKRGTAIILNNSD